MEPQQAIDYTLALAREHRLANLDLVLSREQSLSIKVLDGRVEKVDQSTGIGLGIRVVRQGRTGIAFTERLAKLLEFYSPYSKHWYYEKRRR